VAIGLPCVTAAPEHLEWLQARAEQDPSTSVALDLATSTLQAGERSIPVFAPASAIEAFTSGAWDATGLLLEDAAAVKATAARLPYVSGF
jgi:3-isopropylmalate/(R)-2-methylmalate dehydratase small subunit